MASAQNREQEWDSRPLPTGWSRGYDEENQRCFYFRYDTRPPSISFTHPLDIGQDLNDPPVGRPQSSRSVPRPLPRPTGSAPSYEPAPLVPSKESPPPSYTNPVLSPPSPKPILSSPYPKPTPQPQHSAAMRNPPTKMSVAQQLYASSFANRAPSGPSFSVPPPIIESLPHGPDQPSLYKHSVAAHVSPSSPPALRPRSPTSTISSRSSVRSPRSGAPPPSAYGSEPQSPPYSEFSLPDDDPRESSPGTSAGAHSNSTPHRRGRSESNGHFQSVIPPVQENPIRSNHVTAHNVPNQTRSLFPLTYIDVNGSKAPDVKSVSTIAKPPPGSKAVANAANHTRNFVPANPFPTQVPTGLDTLRPDAPFVVGSPLHGQTWPTHLTTSSVQPTVAAQYAGPIPPPPPLPRTQSAPASPPLLPTPSFQQQQKIPVAPPRLSHSHSQPNPPLQPPTVKQHHQQVPTVPIRPPQNSSQSNPPRPQPLAGPERPVPSTTSGTTRPSNPPKPKTRTNGFMGNLGSSLASSLGRTAVNFGAQAILSTIGVEEEEEDDGGGIADALVAGISNLTVGGDGGGGESAPAPPPQPVSAMSMTAYSAGLPSLEFNFSSGGNGGSNPNNPNGNNSGNSWNPVANQQTATNSNGNMYPNHTGIPNGAQRPIQPLQHLHPVYQHPQSANWNPYHYS